MKKTYERYGRRTSRIEESLPQADRDILEKFLVLCSITSGKERVGKYRCYILQFRDLVEKPFDQITTDDAMGYWGLVKHAPFEHNTKVDMLACAKKFLKWYYKDLDMLENLKVPKPKLNEEKINKAALVKPHELQLMLRRAEKLRDKALLMVLAESGGRPEEIRKLKWGYIDFDEQDVSFYSSKTTRARSPPLREALQHLQRWKDEWIAEDPQDDDYVFPATVYGKLDRSRCISTTYIGRVVATIAKKAGIRRRIHPYLFRHTRYTELKRAGISGKQLDDFAGHVPGSRQQAVYDHLDNSDMKQMIVEKVYEAKGLKKPERDQYEERLKQLETQLSSVQEQNQVFSERLQVLTDALNRIDVLSKAMEELTRTGDQKRELRANPAPAWVSPEVDSPSSESCAVEWKAAQRTVSVQPETLTTGSPHDPKELSQC